MEVLKSNESIAQVPVASAESDRRPAPFRTLHRSKPRPCRPVITRSLRSSRRAATPPNAASRSESRAPNWLPQPRPRVLTKTQNDDVLIAATSGPQPPDSDGHTSHRLVITIPARRRRSPAHGGRTGSDRLRREKTRARLQQVAAQFRLRRSHQPLRGPVRQRQLETSRLDRGTPDLSRQPGNAAARSK